VEQNNALKESINPNNYNLVNAIDTTVNSIEEAKNDSLNEKMELMIEDTSDVIETTSEPIKVEFTPSQTKNQQQHYYIVKEIIMNKTSNAVVSTFEYEFANTSLYTSKVDARLFYDNKIAIHSNKDENSVVLYELYIVNNVFFDAKKNASAIDISTDEIKTYLLIDGVGKEQADGRNFESFALRAASQKMNQRHDSQSISISTKNSFLDGNYKD